MFQRVTCDISTGANRQQCIDQASLNFIQTVLEEDRRVNKVYERDIQQTAENPRIRSQEELTKISIELSVQKKQEINDERRRQQLRENSVQIRQLQSYLGAAHVAQALTEQNVARQESLQAAAQRKQEEAAAIRRRQQLSDEAVQKEEQQRSRSKEAFRMALREQMVENMKRYQKQREGILEEHRSMTELQRTLETQRQAEMRALAQRKQLQYAEIKKCMALQEQLKQQAKAEGHAQLEEFQRMVKEREAKEQRAKEEKHALKCHKERLSENIGKQLFRLQNEKLVHEKELLDLLVEEQRAKDDERFKQNMWTRQREREKIYNELEHYQLLLSGQKGSVRSETEHWQRQRQQMLAERDRLHKIDMEKNREKAREHGDAIKGAIEANIRRRLEDMRQQRHQSKTLNKAEQENQRKIFEECNAIIKGESPVILKFLPKHIKKQFLG